MTAPRPPDESIIELHCKECRYHGHVIEYSAYLSLRQQLEEIDTLSAARFAQLEWERDEYKRLAESWMADYDRLKSIYEPMVGALAERKGE